MQKEWKRSRRLVALISSLILSRIRYRVPTVFNMRIVECSTVTQTQLQPLPNILTVPSKFIQLTHTAR